MKILFLEPFYGGSHKHVADSFAAHSSHEIDILSLPPRFWKWRMRGAALEFIRKIDKIAYYDLIFATDMMDLTDFKGVAGKDCPPIYLYFHENQLSYPLGPHEKRDFHLGFTNIISALAADRVFFNSHFHRDDFFKAARTLIKQMPDFRPTWMIEEIQDKTQILYPGFDFNGDPGTLKESGLDRPLIIWNHRWEYDKNPAEFFNVLRAVKEKGILFYLAVMGEQYEIIPDEFEQAKIDFKDELLVYGYLSSSDEYRQWLSKGTVVVSTAIQENFGIAVMEAIASGCFPLLPDRLSYPELIPGEFKEKVIYSDEAQLVEKLEQVLTHPEKIVSDRLDLSVHAAGFSWKTLVKQWDTALEVF